MVESPESPEPLSETPRNYLRDLWHDDGRKKQERKTDRKRKRKEERDRMKKVTRENNTMLADPSTHVRLLS